jgi:hypothetical protein
MKPKRIFIQLIFIVYFVQTLTAQSYDAVSTGRECMFKNEFVYKSIRIDSLKFENDTAYYFNFTTLRYDNFNCYKLGKPSWIGKYVIVCPNGDNLFFNKNNDTIRIKTAVLPGESWICFRYSDGNYIESIVSLVSEESFLGLTDSVKTITFQFKDANGNNIIHPINQEVLKISMEFGMVHALNFYLFPDMIEYTPAFTEYFNSYELIGMTNPNIGLQNLTWKEVFSFEIGDELHSYSYSSVVPPWTEFVFINIRKIIDKQIFPIGDSVKYSYANCWRYTISNETDTNVISHQDTTIQVIYSHNDYFDVLADEPSFSVDFIIHLIENCLYNNSTRAKQIPVDLQFGYNDSCASQILSDGIPSEYYIEGLGGPYWEDINWGLFHNYCELVYYKKGEVEWGTPYNCDSLLVGEKEVFAKEAEISLFPNPVTESFFVVVKNPEYLPAKIIVADIFGNIVITEQIDRTKTKVNCRKLRSGMFLYSVIFETGISISGKVIIE